MNLKLEKRFATEGRESAGCTTSDPITHRSEKKKAKNRFNKMVARDLEAENGAD